MKPHLVLLDVSVTTLVVDSPNSSGLFFLQRWPSENTKVAAMVLP